MVKWEGDLDKDLDLANWLNLAQNASKSFINTSMIEANCKALLRWYTVPQNLSHMSPVPPLSALGDTDRMAQTTIFDSHAHGSGDFGLEFVILYIL